MKKILLSAVLALGVSMSAQASTINIGGVNWDPDQSLAFPALSDFLANGTIFETGATIPGSTVTGQGQVTQINSAVPNGLVFCPTCELTFTFSMELVSFVGTPNASLGGVDGNFTFKDLNIKFVVDTFGAGFTAYDGTFASAANGALWLELELNPSNFLTGTGTALGSGSDQGTGSGVLDIISGGAMSNFDTNTQAAGGDFTLTSSFQPTTGAPGLLNGTFDLKGNSIPEPSSIALLGLGLLGLGFGARRKSVK